MNNRITYAFKYTTDPSNLKVATVGTILNGKFVVLWNCEIPLPIFAACFGIPALCISADYGDGYDIKLGVTPMIAAQTATPELYLTSEGLCDSTGLLLPFIYPSEVDIDSFVLRGLGGGIQRTALYSGTGQITEGLPVSGGIQYSNTWLGLGQTFGSSLITGSVYYADGVSYQTKPTRSHEVFGGVYNTEAIRGRASYGSEQRIDYGIYNVIVSNARNAEVLMSTNARHMLVSPMLTQAALVDMTEKTAIKDTLNTMIANIAPSVDNIVEGQASNGGLMVSGATLDVYPTVEARIPSGFMGVSNATATTIYAPIHFDDVPISEMDILVVTKIDTLLF